MTNSLFPTEEEQDSFKMRMDTPTPGIGVNKKAVYVSLAVLGAFLLQVLVTTFSAPKEAEATTERKVKSTKATPSGAFTSLPENYSFLKQEKKEEKTPVFKEERKESFKTLLSETEKERLKTAKKARESGLFFKTSFKAKKHSSASRARGISTGMTPPDMSKLMGGMMGGDSDPNGQSEKMAFLEQDRTDSHVLLEPLRAPVSKFTVSAGTVVPGVMLGGVNSDLPGHILGQVSGNVYDTTDGAYLLIPQGTRVIGRYDSQVTYGQSRVLIVWTRLMFPNGTSLSLKGMPGVDLSGYAGISDEVDNHYLKILSGVVLSSTLSAAASVASGTDYSREDSSFEDLLGQGVSKDINKVGQEITRKNINLQPTITIRPGKRFNIFVTKDLLLTEYSDS